MRNFEFNRMRNAIENKSKKEKSAEVLKPHDDFEVNKKDKEESREFNEFESLRISLQELIDPQTEEGGIRKKEDIKIIKDILSEDLLEGYKDILKNFRKISAFSEEHSGYGFIDIENEDVVEKIETWIKDVNNAAKEKREWNEDDLGELESQCWIFFDSLALSLNVKFLERNIKNRKLLKGSQKYENDKKKLVEEMKGIYPFDEHELGVLVDLISDKENEYNFNSLKDALVYVYERYELNEVRGASGKALGTYLLANSLQALGPFFLQDISSDRAAMSSLEFIGSYVSAERVEVKADLMQIEVSKYLSEKINREIGKSLLFRDFEFIHDKTTGEAYETLMRGKNATIELVRLINSRVIPKIYSLIASICLLSKINPVLGGVGLAGVPVMITMAKKQNQKIGEIYKEEMVGQEKANVKITQTKEILEEIRATGLPEETLQELAGSLDRLDNLKFQREGLEIKSRIARMLPSHVTAAGSVVIGELLRRGGYVEGGAILSSIVYSYQLNEPIQELVGLYYESFPRFIQAIDKMKELLGEEEDLDLPEGEREKYRISVSELENFDIDIKNLRHKNISKEINLKINEGDFIIITGESGAGKTTLLRHVMGLFKSESGGITMGGVSIEGIKKYGDDNIGSILGYCNQKPQIFKNETLRDNLLLWSKQEVSDEKINGVLDELNLGKFVDKLDDNIKYVSGGEAVRIGLARVLLKDPKIMILDEPTASLDVESRQEVINIIERIRIANPEKTIISVSHDEEFINKSDRVYEF